ncbi:MAG: transposase [Bdellovibrionales bacterium]|nr:transposase [Bdellovibrionales bacterium]
MKSRGPQMKFQDQSIKQMHQFGGSLLKNSNAKTKRPISTKHAMHVVLRSSLARGEWSLRSAKNLRMVEKTVRTQAQKYGIKIYEFANVGNHLHLLIKVGNRHTFAPFMRAISGIIALKVTGARKAKELKQKFWDYRPWSRVVQWRKAYSVVKDYVVQNHLEAIGAVPYQPRRRRAPA